ncbi:DUF5788 family protein [Halomarina oriensis]|uniref:Uncharacterized protein n=1 Tax=Halomarina oriensis TaxID=671145 RepID=A0A6B0GNI2_9EURY|nr:DUF5788 family protein [Halomarina oriensis]MWG35069.1 hypothetical protein [Halomarina oriensis]
MDELTRQRLLDRIGRPSKTVGVAMPDELTVDGTTIDPNELVFECSKLETIPDAEREQLESAKKTLRRERLRRKQRIADGDVTVEEGEALATQIHGLDRALNALEELDTPSFGEELRQKKLDDARELLALVRL